MLVRSKAVPVLMYHHVSPASGPYTVSPERFASQLDWLIQQNYHCLSGAEFQHYRQTGKLPWKRCVLITFDDGWLDNWVHAAPLLQERGLSAVLFVVTGWISEGPERPVGYSQGDFPRQSDAMAAVADDQLRDSVMMRWSELLQLQQWGVFQLQCHSHSHGSWWKGNCRGEILDAFAEDLHLSRRVFKEKTGTFPTQFCWPKGQFCHSMKRMVREAGFDLQYATLRGTNRAPRPSDAQVRRLNVENRPLDWFASRVRLYSKPWVGELLGRVHQDLNGRRMMGDFGDVLGKDEFRSPFWAKV